MTDPARTERFPGRYIGALLLVLAFISFALWLDWHQDWLCFVCGAVSVLFVFVAWWNVYE